jgi:hypothetical protein
MIKTYQILKNMDYKLSNKPKKTKSEKINLDNRFKPYFILRYGYLIDKLDNTDKYDYETFTCQSDSIQIFTDEFGGISSTIPNIAFALINNHNLPNENLPKQYLQSEIAIITHEAVHAFVEIIINLHFKKLTKVSTERSFSDLGEGLALAFQYEFLDIRTHYTSHDYTPYLLIGKAYFSLLKETLGDSKRLELKNLFSTYSKNIKDKYFQMREEFIKNGRKNNDIVTRFDFSDFSSEIASLEFPTLLDRVKDEVESITNILDLKTPIRNPASVHMPKNSGYINGYLIEANENGNLNHEKTIDQIKKVGKLLT